MMEKKYLECQHIDKYYGKNQVIHDLCLSVTQGEFLILLGSSGCGKSTTLRMIAGLEPISSGDLMIDGRRMNDVPAGERDIAMVFQDYALYPHMTVEKNITYALKVNKVAKGEIDKRLNEVLKILHLGDYRNRYPRQLSGGQRQRVALARAIAKHSPIFLLDEPLSNLDAQMRIRARRELLNIHRLYHQTIIYVTHDQIEAMTLGDRIVLMSSGKLQMVDTPYNTYHYPVNVFTAKFIGTPATNIIEAEYEAGHLRFGSAVFQVDPAWQSLISRSKQNRFYLGIRPEYIHMAREAHQSQPFAATVVRVEEYGSQYGVILHFDAQELTVISDQRDWQEGQNIYFGFDQRKMYLFDRETTNTIGFPDHGKYDSVVALSRTDGVVSDH